VQRGKDDGPPRLEELAGRLLGSVLDLGWALWTTAREVADFSLRAVRAAADVLFDASLPPARRSGRVDPKPGRAEAPTGGATERPRPGKETPGVAGASPPSPLPPPPGADPFAPPLPADVDRDRLVAVERDPGTLFAFWDLRAETRARARAEIGGETSAPGDDPRTVLRVVVDGGAPRDLEFEPYATSGYVERPGDHVAVEVTLGLARRDRFARLAGPFFVPARPIGSASAPVEWRRVHGGSPDGARAAEPGDRGSLAVSPSPGEIERLAALSEGRPATGSPPWPGGRRRGPVPGPGGEPGLPSS
jgi:hypothetical protein